MANISVPKTLFGIIYFLIPLLVWFVPSIGEMLPEPWMAAAIVAVIFVIGLFFVFSQAGILLRIITIILLIASLAYAGYQEYPSVNADFIQVDADYQSETGSFYTVEETAFQVKQEVVIAHIVTALPAFFNAAWLTTGIMLLLLGALGLKEVFSYAAIPSNQSSRSLDSNAEIPDDVAAVTSRPSAEQRAAALANIKATSASSAAPAPTAPPSGAAESAPRQSSSTQSPFSMPSFSGTSAPADGAPASAGPEPVIKIPETNTMSSTSTIDTSYSRRNLDSPVTSDGKVNIKLDLGEDPAITVEHATLFRSADGTTSYYQEPGSSNPFEELKHEAETIRPQSEPDYSQPSIPQFSGPVSQEQPVYSEPVTAAASEPAPSSAFETAPEPVPAPAPVSEPAAEANPFASIGNPFGQKSEPAAASAPAPAPVTETVSEPAPNPLKDVNPFATMSNPFEKKAAPASAPVSSPAPAPAPAQASAPAPAPAPASPAKPEKPRMSEEAKQRIKELNNQVAELKTLYNQGMISQDEYIAQRTELLREMYNSEK